MNFSPPGISPGEVDIHSAPPEFDGLYHAQPDVHSVEGDFQPMHSIMVDGGNHFGVSSISFDAHQELLWMGNQGGHVTSYYGMSLQKYTSSQIHLQQYDIRQLLTLDKGVLSLMRDRLQLTTRFGRTSMNYSSESLVDMQSMLLQSDSSLLMGGHQDKLIEFDINKVKEVQQVEVEKSGCAIMRKTNRFLFTGDTSGKISLRDPKTFTPEHTFTAHSGTLSDFDVQGNLLITCGFGSRMGSLSVDRTLKVYDMRMLRAVAPIQSPIEPQFLRFIPSYLNRLMVVSQSGQFILMDAGTLAPTPISTHQIPTHGAGITSFDMSSTHHCLAFGDSSGYLHLYSTGPEAKFNQYSRETEFADQPDHYHPISITDELTPYSVIPTLYTSSGNLLSHWPMHLRKMVYRVPKPIDSEILRSMKIIGNVGYAPNPGKFLRNQRVYKMEKASKLGRPRKQSVPDSPMGRGDDPFVSVPKRYRKVEIKYSKLGMEDFDFRFYNKTNFAGLETHIPNAYCNAMLQILYFIEPLRCALESHLCEKEFCLACELGFLFHMLDLQKGQTCQASNFLRAFRTIPEASALGLILSESDESAGNANFPRLIQSWTRFVLQQVHSETAEEGDDLETENDEVLVDPEKEAPSAKEEAGDDQKVVSTEESETSQTDLPTKPDLTLPLNNSPKRSKKAGPSIVSKLMSADVTNSYRCKCGEATNRESSTLLFNLNYPELYPQGNDKEPSEYKFSYVASQSLSAEVTTQAWCNVCQRYQPQTQTKQLKNLPDVLTFNCHIENERDYEFWQVQQQFVKAAEELEEAQAPPPVFSTPTKMCRYGNQCKRQDCRYGHENGGPKTDPELDMSRLLDEEMNKKSWVPLGLKVKLKPDGKVEVVDGIDCDSENAPKKENNDDGVIYDFFASVAHIKEAKSGGHLVCHTYVGKTYHQRKEKVTCTQCYLLNDFSITPIEKQEAVYFNMDWKIPCTIMFLRRNYEQDYNIKVSNPITSDVLLMDASLVTPRRKSVTFTPLDPDRLPMKGDVIGLDAEFVTLNQEEAEWRSDGTKSTIKPSQMSVARISCICKDDTYKGEPFLDDYISTQEQVVDYLTQFSGIKPGDLDAAISSKHLTTLKLTYQKLRYMVDVGVVFAGHGLKKDFRVINVVVPKEQIIDTVELFRLPRQRMISLKFLAWYFLGESIQSETHDSIEDARTALKLYDKYQELSSKGGDKGKEALKEMYEKGRQIEWKIPDNSTDSSVLASGVGSI